MEYHSLPPSTTSPSFSSSKRPVLLGTILGCAVCAILVVVSGSSTLGFGVRATPMTMSHQPVLTSRAGNFKTMARVGGVDIPNRKRLEISLQSIYGIGSATAQSIIHNTQVENKRVYELEEEELTKVRAEVDKYVIEGDLRRQIRQDIARLIDIQCFRGKRHQAGLPCRGQNTKNNARTRKRNRHVKI
mmetsp:Transcript_11579/g.18547  ORF Transcript_11579/g.18547 Transcript_11579/m.18547 type:complete len:188 (-) Transcript_11579:165-728(-)